MILSLTSSEIGLVEVGWGVLKTIVETEATEVVYIEGPAFASRSYLTD